jgi:hypothetical protein
MRPLKANYRGREVMKADKKWRVIYETIDGQSSAFIRAATASLACQKFDDENPEIGTDNIIDVLEQQE